MFLEVQRLFDTFAYALETFYIDENENKVQYTLRAYDSIDQDLDYDEEYYEHMMCEFKRWLHIYMRAIIDEHPDIKSVCIITTHLCKTCSTTYYISEKGEKTTHTLQSGEKW